QIRGRKRVERRQATRRPPDTAIPDIRDFQNQVPVEFALHTEAVLILARGTIRIRIQIPGSPNYATDALSRIRSQVRENRVERGGNPTLQLADPLAETRSAGGICVRPD